MTDRRLRTTIKWLKTLNCCKPVLIYTLHVDIVSMCFVFLVAINVECTWIRRDSSFIARTYLMSTHIFTTHLLSYLFSYFQPFQLVFPAAYTRYFGINSVNKKQIQLTLVSCYLGQLKADSICEIFFLCFFSLIFSFFFKSISHSNSWQISYWTSIA